MWKQNKSNKPLPGSYSMQDRLARRIAQSAIKLQSLFSLFLASRAAKLSSRTLKSATLIICVSWVAASIYFIVTAFTTDIPQPSFVFSRIKTRALVRGHNKESLYTDINVSGTEYAALQTFRKYMDSLRKHLNPAYDSILAARPGLMDSVQLLENIYNHPKK